MKNGLNLRYPKGLFTDVRMEKVYKTIIQRRDGRLTDFRNRLVEGAFVRVFDGVRWYMSGFTDMNGIQGQIDQLATLTSSSLEGKSELQRFMTHMNMTTGQIPLNSGCPVFSIPAADKQRHSEALEKQLMDSKNRRQHELFYTDFHVEKRMLNSLGGDVAYAKQGAGLWISADFKSGTRLFSDRYVHACDTFEGLLNETEKVAKSIQQSEVFVKDSEPLTPGTYEVILSPSAAGLFAHESVGHLSEADFSAEVTSSKETTALDETPKSQLTVYDDGGMTGWGYTPFDDEGMPCQKTLLVEQGIRKNRMHSLDTAWRQGQQSTGNGRAVDYSFEPMVRMTNTYIRPGTQTLDALKASVHDGVLIENVAGGFGMENFTLTPLRCWRIQNGQVTGPVTASVVTGKVDQAVAKVSMISSDFEMHAMVKGGCGKMDQFPLDVGFGGPHIKVEELQIW